jgi:hypothetical protein
VGDDLYFRMTDRSEKTKGVLLGRGPLLAANAGPSICVSHTIKFTTIDSTLDLDRKFLPSRCVLSRTNIRDGERGQKRKEPDTPLRSLDKVESVETATFLFAHNLNVLSWYCLDQPCEILKYFEEAFKTKLVSMSPRFQ